MKQNTKRTPGVVACYEARTHCLLTDCVTTAHFRVMRAPVSNQGQNRNSESGSWVEMKGGVGPEERGGNWRGRLEASISFCNVLDEWPELPTMGSSGQRCSQRAVMVSDVPRGQLWSAMFPQGSSGQQCSHRAVMVSDVPREQFRLAMIPQGSSGQRCSHRAVKVSAVPTGQFRSAMFPQGS